MRTVKICGLRRKEDIEAVNVLLPEYAGMILSSGFRRSLSRETAAELKAALDKRIKMCGVFVNEETAFIRSFLEEGIIDIVQFHGNEKNSQIDELHSLYPGLTVFKAFRVRNKEDLKEAAESHADHVLLDSGTGTGRTFDWELIRDFPRPYILAGGLDPENVGEALRILTPIGLDVSSGVETDGMKDPLKMKAFVEAVRGKETV